MVHGYNHRVKVQWLAAAIVLSADLIAQSAPASCPADRPVDEIITEVHNQQSKKKHRNVNLFPEVVCVFGWCRDNSKTPPTVPAPAPRAQTPTGDKESSSSRSSNSVSPSTIPVDKCDEAMELALEAAHNVDVGDYSFAEKNYQGALMRYKDAVAEKPADAAIHVRLGRAFEKLGQLPQAIEQYSAAQKMPGPAKWRDEASTALVRLHSKAHPLR